MRRGVSQRPPCRFEVIKVNPAKWAAGAAPSPSRVGDAESAGGGAGGDAGAGEGSSSASDSAGAAVTVVLDVAHNPPAIVGFFDKVCVCCDVLS